MFPLLRSGDDWDFHKSEVEGNTGFYYARSNTRTESLWETVVNSVREFPGLDDQSIFWSIIRRADINPPVLPLPRCIDYSNKSEHISDTRPIVTCALDGCMFSAGALRGVAYTMLRDGLRKRNGTLHTIHANYIKGNENKKRALELHGYWLATRTEEGHWDGPCKSFTPKI